MNGSLSAQPERLDRPQEGVGSAREVSVEPDLSGAVEHADVHRAGVEIHATVERMLGSVESQRGLLRKKGCGMTGAYRVGALEGGLESVSDRWSAREKRAAQCRAVRLINEPL